MNLRHDCLPGLQEDVLIEWRPRDVNNPAPNLIVMCCFCAVHAILAAAMWGHAQTSAHMKAVDDPLEGRDSPEQHQSVAAAAPCRREIGFRGGGAVCDSPPFSLGALPSAAAPRHDMRECENGGRWGPSWCRLGGQPRCDDGAARPPSRRSVVPCGRPTHIRYVRRPGSTGVCPCFERHHAARRPVESQAWR
jgi:hypothetical protein